MLGGLLPYDFARRYFGKGLISKVAYDKAYKACNFPSTSGA
jgi:hypothetical protein